MPFGWGEAEEAHRQVQGYEPEKNEGHLSHDLIAGAASFAAMKAFDEHQRKQGKEVSHSTAKEIIAGLAGAGVTRLVETKGRDAIDEHKAKKQAEENAQRMYEEHYERKGPHFNPNEHEPHPAYDRNRFDEHPRPHGGENRGLDRW